MATLYVIYTFYDKWLPFAYVRSAHTQRAEYITY